MLVGSLCVVKSRHHQDTTGVYLVYRLPVTFARRTEIPPHHFTTLLQYSTVGSHNVNWYIACFILCRICKPTVLTLHWQKLN